MLTLKVAFGKSFGEFDFEDDKLSNTISQNSRLPHSIAAIKPLCLSLY